MVIADLADDLAARDEAYVRAVESARVYRELFLLTLTFLHAEYRGRLAVEERLRQVIGLEAWHDAETAEG